MKNFKIHKLGITFFLSFIFFSSCQQVKIKSSERGVIFKRFDGGLDVEKIYPSGSHIISPWNKIIIYNIESQTDGETISILTRDGLAIDLDLNYNFKLIPKEIGNLHQQIGHNYKYSIIKPEIRSAIREVIGKYLSKDIPLMEIRTIENEIFEKAKKPIRKNFIELESFTINEIGYPNSMKKE